MALQKKPATLACERDFLYQVVRNTSRIFTDQAAGMRAHRVEIAQHTDLPLGVGMHDIGQDLLTRMKKACGVAAAGWFSCKRHRWANRQV